MRRIAALAVTGILLAPCAAVAQSPATIRGQVYDCKTGQAMALATVELRNLDDGTTLAMQAANDGRFVRVGVQPGRYLISATGPSLGQSPQYTRLGSTTASRLARVDTDDVLDVRIGTNHTLHVISYLLTRGTGTLPARDPNEPRPVCDPAVVPPAPPTSDRYVIH
jgi:carboxypeptidase family protein